MNKLSDKNGFVLVTVLIILVTLSIFVATLVLMMRQEGKLVVKHKRKSTAIQLAEAGADRGRSYRICEVDIPAG